MNVPRTLQDIYCEERRNPIYAISPRPEWQYWDPVAFPRPIKEWLDRHCPGVAIERCAGFELVEDAESDAAPEGNKRKFTLFHPVFAISFSEKQARHFDQAWSSPPLQLADGTENFYFLVCTDGDQQVTYQDEPAA
jgi:hypothetical protein